MKIKINYLILFLILVNIIVPIKDVFASVATEIKVEGKKLEFDYNKLHNCNDDETVVFEYTPEYEGGLLTLKEYKGGFIEINHIIGSGTEEPKPHTLYIKIEGENRIDSNEIAILSNIDFNIIGTGTLTTNAKLLHNEEVNIVVEDTVKIKMETEETDDNKVKIENKNNLPSQLITTALVLFIVLCSLGSGLLIIKIIKAIRK